jgi:DNA-binding NarL/FixJ family response regulator
VGGVDVLVVDGRLLEEAASQIPAYDSLALVVLTDNERTASLLRALAPRGWAIVLPDAPAAEFRAAVLAAGQGLVVLPQILAERLLIQPQMVQTAANAPLEEPLTAREREVLELLSEGLSNKLIARKLQISEHTVKFHISSVYAKLGASSRTEAVRRGAHLGLIAI